MRPYRPVNYVSKQSASTNVRQLEHTQDFSENENKNHANEESGLLSSTPHTSITDNANGEAGGQTCQTNGQTGTELDEAGEEGGLLFEVVGDEDGNDETVDTNDTSHNDGDNI
jgi:hypothetical protein